MWRRIFTVLVLVTATLGAGCLGDFLHPPVVPPAIVPVEGAVLDHTPVYTFAFGDGEETLRIDPDPTVYAGAKGADRQLYLSETLSREEWIPIYYRAFVNDTHQEPFYTDLLAALREIRDRKGLDDDRYLELVTAFVQSIPYKTDASIVEPKFPIETYVDGEGDCDDKSLLLAGLLAREGYGVALLYFGDEAHMAVGVKSAGCPYGNTPFAYIETTNASYVGIPPAALSDGTVLATDPLVIPVGDGPRLYTACGEIETIERALSVSRDRVEELAPELAARTRDIEMREEALESLATRMEALSRAGEIREYNRLVPEYNRMVREYNDAAGSYNLFREDSLAAVDLHNHLIAHAHDRPGSYLLAREYLAA